MASTPQWAAPVSQHHAPSTAANSHHYFYASSQTSSESGSRPASSQGHSSVGYQSFSSSASSLAGSAAPPAHSHHSLLPNPSGPASSSPASTLDQQLTSLSMEQHTSSTSTAAASSLANMQGLVHYPGIDDDFGGAMNPNEEYLNQLNRDRFLPITSFFRHFVADEQNQTIPEFKRKTGAITRSDLQGDQCDVQGINWSAHRASRAVVRAKRAAFESERLSPHVQQVRRNTAQTPVTENYYSFKRMNTDHQASIPHFQLRNLVACTSRDNIFYADRDVVRHTDAEGTRADTVMDLTKEMTESGKFQVTTLASSDDILIAGGFEGEYALVKLSDPPYTPTVIGRTKDRARDSKSHITNHIHFSKSRFTYTPQAVLSSNDNRLRVLDCTTNTFTHSFGYSQAVNCSATSPDGRMRVVVGDFRETYITNAETGQAFETLKTHTDDAFACDWADDGIHVATAAQDSTIVIWDARNWAQPLKVLNSELSIPRCLRFSPVGGGPRVLISAEADDYLNIINAQTFESRQVFDFFGRTAGITMTPDGSSLFLASSEPHYGGIMEFERCGWGERRSGKKDVDWCAEDSIDGDARALPGKHERARRGINLAGLTV